MKEEIALTELPENIINLITAFREYKNKTGNYDKWISFTQYVHSYEYYVLTLNKSFTKEHLIFMRNTIKDFGWWKEEHEESLFCLLFGESNEP